MSPDAWFYWACRIHDYEYYLLREKWDFKFFQCSTSLKGDDIKSRRKLNAESWWVNRISADANLKTNIKILTRYKIKNGVLKRKRFPRLLGYFISNLYYTGVRAFGRKAARG